MLLGDNHGFIINVDLDTFLDSFVSYDFDRSRGKSRKFSSCDPGRMGT